MSIILKDNTFKKDVETTVLPYIDQHKTCGEIERGNQEKYYYEHFEPDHSAIGTIVIIHGFAEFIPKYYESIYYMLNAGYAVWIMQQTPDFLSFKFDGDNNIVQINDHQTLVDNMQYFIENIVIPASDPEIPRILYSHSMGGAIAACILGRCPDLFDKAILSSPMMQINTGNVPLPLIYVLTKTMILAGRGKQGLPGRKPLSTKYDYDSALTLCHERYEYLIDCLNSDIRMHASIPSYNTAYQLYLLSKDALSKDITTKIKTKVLLFQSFEDSMVTSKGQNIFIRRIKNGELIRLPGTRHEIFMSGEKVLKRYWRRAFKFFRA